MTRLAYHAGTAADAPVIVSQRVEVLTDLHVELDVGTPSSKQPA